MEDHGTPEAEGPGPEVVERVVKERAGQKVHSWTVQR